MAKCKLGSVLENPDVPEIHRTLLGLVLRNREDWPARRISTALGKTEYPVGVTTIKEHRRGECGCYNGN